MVFQYPDTTLEFSLAVVPRRNSRNPKDPSTESLLRLAEKTGLDGDPKTQRLIQRVAATDNCYLKRQLEKALAVKASQHSVHPFYSEKQSQPVPTPMWKQVTFGSTSTGDLYLLPQDDFTKHLLTVGQSGTGKTTLFYNLMNQVTVPYWSFDLKQDCRHLIQRERIHEEAIDELESKLDWYLDQLKTLYKPLRGDEERENEVKSRIKEFYRKIREEKRVWWRDRQELEMERREVLRELEEVSDGTLGELL